MYLEEFFFLSPRDIIINHTYTCIIHVFEYSTVKKKYKNMGKHSSRYMNKKLVYSPLIHVLQTYENEIKEKNT